MQLLTRQQVKDRKKTESPIESVILREFHLLGFYPTPQYWIGNYRVDLAFIDDRVVVECDGKEWHTSQEQIEKDRLRDEFLKLQGWHIIRVSGSEIYRKAGDIVKEILGLPKRKISINSKMASSNPNWDTDDNEEYQEIIDKAKQEYEESENILCGTFSKIGELISERYKHSI